MSFGNDFAEVFYTAKVGVEVFWNRERRFVIDAQQVTVVEAFDEYSATASYGAAVGDGGKISVQGRIIGGMAISGRPASCEVDVKNSSPRKACPYEAPCTCNISQQFAPGIGYFPCID